MSRRVGVGYLLRRLEKTMDFKTGTSRVSKYFLILSIAALPQVASATITACPVTQPGTALSTYTTGGTPSAATGAVGTGCSSVNLSFENVSITSATATGVGV